MYYLPPVLFFTLQNLTLFVVHYRYRQFNRPQAINGLFRLRTSKEFKPANAYGPFYGDPKYENLYHIESCDEFRCFGFDFEFTGPQSFST